MEAFQRLEDFLKRQPMPFDLWLRKTTYERLQKIRRYHVDAARRSVATKGRLRLLFACAMKSVRPLRPNHSFKRTRLRRSA